MYVMKTISYFFIPEREDLGRFQVGLFCLFTHP